MKRNILSQARKNHNLFLGKRYYNAAGTFNIPSTWGSSTDNFKEILNKKEKYNNISLKTIKKGEAVSEYELFDIDPKIQTEANTQNENEANSMKLPPMPTIGQLLKIYKVAAKKKLAQNFILDKSLNSKIIRHAGPLLGNHVCEVGPGPGGITRCILEEGVKSLTVVEKDRRFMPSLRFLAESCENKLNIVLHDILYYDILNAFPIESEKPWNDVSPNLNIIGNLPFNVSLPLLFQLLDSVSQKTKVFELGRIPMLFVFQHEVGERLVAEPRDVQRCRLSVTSQYLCNVKYRFMIKGSSFTPAPKVDAAVVTLVPRKTFIIDLPFKIVDKVAKHVFHFRQKYCRRGISSLYPPKRDDLVQATLKVAGVNPEERPFALDNMHFRDLSYAYCEIATKIPELNLLDTYSPKEWLKFFNEDGEPLSTNNEVSVN